MAEKQFKNFYKEINHYWNGKYCSVDILRETLDKQLYPNKINYVILNEEKSKFAGAMVAQGKSYSGRKWRAKSKSYRI